MSDVDKAAIEAFKELSARDQDLVRAWHDLGNSWVTSLVNSGVLTSRWRAHPSDAPQVVEAWKRADQAIEMLRRQSLPPGPAAARRLGAEHESAHAVTADALGHRVSEVFLREDGTGQCRLLDEEVPRDDSVAIALAAEVWIYEFRVDEYRVATIPAA